MLVCRERDSCNSMDYHVLLTFGIVMSFSLICHARPSANHTCMHEWMVQSGIPLENAVNYEVTIRSVHYSVQALNRSSSLAIGILIMDGNVRNASSLKACLAGTKCDCQNYDPCGRGGSCILSDDKSTYKCHCPEGRKGHFCQHNTDNCASNPCQHGGFCKDGVTNFTCTCAAGFEGVVCEKRWLTNDYLRDLPRMVTGLQEENSEMVAQIKELQEKNNATMAKMKELQEENRALMQEVGNLLNEANGTTRKATAMQSELAKLQERQTILANRKQDVVGYAYKSFRESGVHDNGRVLSSTFNFTKKENNTLLRLMYSANTRGTTRRYASSPYRYFQIDGSKCTRPGDIDIFLHEYTGSSYSHSPAVLIGICSATSAGKLLAGSHVISVHVKLGQHAYTRSDGKSFLQVQEIIPPF